MRPILTCLWSFEFSPIPPKIGLQSFIMFVPYRAYYRLPQDDQASIGHPVFLSFLKLEMQIYRYYVSGNNNNTISYLYYTKSTYNGRVINFCSNHPSLVKINIARNLISRILTLSNQYTYHNSNLKRTANILSRSLPTS